MGQVSAKLRKTTHGFAWWCPGCDKMHPLPYEKGWSWDGNLEEPTFSPSFKHEWRSKLMDDRSVDLHYVCHYIVTAGKVAYCGDCTHALAGQIIDMPDLPEVYQDRGVDTLGVA
jgi:hypothetical protein